MDGIFLVGFMGCGKSAIGAALADRLVIPFVDLDEVIEDREGMSIEDIFHSKSEAHFRRVETETLLRVACEERQVVATGGGLFQREENRRVIHDRGGISVFLDVPWKVLARRLEVAKEGKRPLYRGIVQAHVLFEARLPTYKDADFVVELTGDESLEQATHRVLKSIQEVACGI